MPIEAEHARIAERQVRVRQLPDRFVGGKWLTKPQNVVPLGDLGKWTMVRNADYPNACPFVISRKDWDKLPVLEALAGQVMQSDL